MADIKTVSELDEAVSVALGDVFHIVQPDGLGGFMSKKTPLSSVKSLATSPSGATSLSIVAGHVAVNAVSLGPFSCTLTENAVLDLPTGGVDGQSIEIDFVQDETGSRTLDLIAFAIPMDATVPVQPTSAGSRSLMAFRLCGSTWCITAFMRFSA